MSTSNKKSDWRNEALKVVLAGGGTSGHVFKALAIAEELKRRRPDVQLTYIGLATGPEAKLAREAGIEFKPVSATKLHRFLTAKNLMVPFKLMKSTGEARAILAAIKPHLVICAGGFVALPVARSAAKLDIPYVMHESDAVLGLANRMAVAAARRLYTAFPPNLFPDNLRPKIVQSGLPIIDKLYPQSVKPGQPTILILGGSQGAHRLNELIQPIIGDLLEFADVIHQAGKLDFPLFEQMPKKLADKPNRYLPVAGIEHKKLLRLMQLTTLAISRAGSSGIELLMSGVPTVFLPLSTAAADHQAKNAQYYVNNEAALCLDERVITSPMLLDFLRHLLPDETRLANLSRHARELFPLNAAQIIVDDLIGPAE